MAIASNTAQADNQGVARIVFTPAVYAASWTVNSVVVRNDGGDVPTVFMYLNGVSDSNLVGGTYSGNFDTDSSPNVTLGSSDSLILVWTNCTPGSNCVGTINYKLDTGRS